MAIPKRYDPAFNPDAQAEADLEGESMGMEGAEPAGEDQTEGALITRLEQFGSMVKGWVSEAVAAREASGIESRWREDLRQYYGEDLTNSQRRSLAEEAAEGPQSSRKEGERQTKSRIVVNITRPKTNAAIARMADMLLPTDDKNWGIQPTPNPKLSDSLSDTTTQLTHQGQDLQNPDGSPATPASAAENMMTEATKRSKAMEREIDDQLTECNYNAEQRKGLWDLGVLGTIILRGPYAKTRVSRKWEESPGRPDRWVAQETIDTVPAATRVSPWRFYPDPSCGGDIQNSRYTVEEDDYNSKTLRALRKQDGYVVSQIDACLREGPRSIKSSGRSMERRYVEGEYQYDEKSIFEVFIVHGEFTKGDLNAAGVEGCECDETDSEDAISGGVLLCNGRVIKAFMNPMDGGDLPYSVAVYEKIDGQVFGVGVPYVLRNPQRVVTAAWRMVMDNAALSSGGQVVINRKLIEPADGSWRLSGTKVWWAREGTDDVTKAFATFQFDTRQQEIMQVIDKAMQFAEDESSMPALMEGSTTDAPQTVGVATTLTNNANTVLRRLVKSYDDDITDSMITRFYNWNMEHSEKAEIKGDYQIDARGSSVLLVRDLQKQALQQSGQFVLHPQLGPFHLRMGYDWLRTMYESNHITPDSILISDDKVEGVIKNMQEAAKQQPQDPQIQIAQMKIEAGQAELKAKLDDAERERMFDHQKWQDSYQLELIKYANQNKMKLEDVRARMTELLLTARHEERMQEREAAVKAQFGTGL